MGFLDFFSKESKDARSIAKWSKRLMNKYQQTQERKRSVDALIQMGSTEAISACLRRYQYRTEASIVDEDEKSYVFESICQLGESAIPSLVQYISTEQGVYWPIKCLRRVAGDEETARHVMAAFAGIEDSFGANAQRREELVDNLRAFADQDDVFEQLCVLLRDEDEEIVIRAIDGLSARENDPRVAEHIVPKLLQDGTSHRLRTMIVEIMTENEWNVRNHKKEMVDVIPENYFIDGTGVVRRK
jgi:hypothetical protein